MVVIGGLSRWRLRFDPLLGQHSFGFFFPFFFFLILHFVTLQESIAFHLKFYYYYTTFIKTFEPPHDKTNTMSCAPSEDSDQPGHSPSLIRVFADAHVIMLILSCGGSFVIFGDKMEP